MKYLICLISIVAVIAVTGCASDQNQASNGRGEYGPEYYQENVHPSTNDINSLPPNYPAFPPENQFGPRRNFP